MQYSNTIKDRVAYTDDLIKGYSVQYGIDEELIRKMYAFYLEKLFEKTKNPETIELPINGFGVFFLPLHGAIIDACAKEKSFNKKIIEKEEAAFYLQRKAVVERKIKKCKECGVKNIRFLHTLLDRNLIKNK